ncbi:hypothetical protein HHK36_016492 [Tetracentron sinense]|uniref:Malectin-like domain-containing protein n=1 Tax=Tetracentron sinense TaxID=13715 RepID=A0A834Z0F1_TETSI|nr:hypothetical protein HHK36_016492 [Tetracentron sinense]
MERRIFIFLVFFAVRALSQATYEWVNIDCGTETNYEDRYGLQWVTDDEFIWTGKNKQVSSSVVVLEQMESLRFFTEQNKNCYSIPASTGVRYFIRAAFFYGNYDGISNPPTFDLEIDGNKWVTVVTSITETVYHEVIYMAKGENISVCVTRTRDNEFPFISSIETWPLPKEMYAGMDRNFAWLKSYRYRYGGTDTIWYPDDNYKRIWDPLNPSGLIPVTADFTSLISSTVDDPPEKGLLKAVEAENPTDSINLEFPFPNSNRFTYLSIYYAEMTELFNDTRSFGFVVDGQDLDLIVSPSYQICSGIWSKTKSSGPLTVDLNPAEGSTLPPIISLIEVYSASDPLITTGTSLDDMNGLDAFISSFTKLQGWSGEPCLPSDTVWQWLNCSGDDPPRITSMYDF